MPSVQISKEEMLKRVARFKGLQPSKKPLLDTRIPGHEREAYRIIIQGVSEDPDARPAIADPHDFNLGLNKAGPREEGSAAQPPQRRGLHPAFWRMGLLVGRQGRERDYPRSLGHYLNPTRSDAWLPQREQ